MAKAAEPGKDKRIVSISTVLFDGYPMGTSIEEIARSGAAYVEPAFIKGYVEFDETTFTGGSARRFRAAVEASGLAVHTVSAHMDLASDDAGSMLDRRIGFAQDVGARVLITNAGSIVARHRILATIRALLPRLERWGGLLALENPGHGSNDLIGSAAEGQTLIGEVGTEMVRLNHDTANVFTYSREARQPEPDWRVAASVIAHGHLKDVRASREGWSFCPLGSGNVDLCSYLAAIPETLPLSIELPLRLERPGRADPERRSRAKDLGELRVALSQSLLFLANPLPARSEMSRAAGSTVADADGAASPSPDQR
ncbi:sugar phosphate isomerase/epimerase family protein [Rhizobium mayense]|uniref:Sugar phosphate isomerase/epimerase family protein n=1 Tax=Rhizobium mayense TaxID=1312184 RepID=A0ABT7JZH6_9HYPH|nr:sugar phosphate isomerase/epimerase family protein [Rhizobium mayense]MDL2401666.1 sugar phosphate isomerase/epimerase family protein [Rhizobium mayense]